MNDILPKPFTKEGLLDMLEVRSPFCKSTLHYLFLPVQKHLMHLKVIQQMSRVPRSVGIPPLSDSSFEQAFTSQAALATASGSGSGSNENSLMLNPASPFNFGLGDDDGRINPLAGMGLTDEQYNMILQNLVNGESFVSGMGMDADNSPVIRQKRQLEDPNDGRDGKRSRFEVIE